jgi:hypothetical protein
MKVTRVPAIVFKLMRLIAGPFSEMQATVSTLALATIAGDPIADMGELSVEFGVRLTSVEEYVASLPK